MSGLAWQSRASCRGLSSDLDCYDEFFPEVGEFSDDGVVSEVVADLCGSCSVRLECLSYALETPVTHGIWGGLLPWERFRLREAMGVS